MYGMRNVRSLEDIKTLKLRVVVPNFTRNTISLVSEHQLEKVIALKITKNQADHESTVKLVIFNYYCININSFVYNVLTTPHK